MSSSQTSRLGTSPTAGIKAPCVTASTASGLVRQGLYTLNGVALAAGDRVLDKDATPAADRGIYIAGVGTWLRAKDWNGNDDLLSGTIVAAAGVVYQATFSGAFNLNVTTPAFEDITLSLRGDLASTTAGKGASLVKLENGQNLQDVLTSRANVAYFHDVDYIAIDQIRLIRAFNVTGQTSATVTAGLQAMHNAMMAFVSADATQDRIAVGRYSGAYACNNEVFSETFAQNLWDLNVNFTRASFQFAGAAHFVVASDWVPGHAAVRTSGFYAQNSITDPVPTALFRWEQDTRHGFAPTMGEIRFEGREDITNDPMLIKMRDVNRMSMSQITVADCAATGLWLENVNNSDIQDAPEISKCGYQPTNFGGTGLLSSTVLFSTTAGAGTTTITATENIFVAAHVGKIFHVEGAGVSGESFYGTITSQSGTGCVVNRQCTTNVTGKHASFESLTGSINADSASLTLDASISTNLVGRYVMIWKAGSKVHTEQGVLVTRVIAHSGTSVTLANQARVTVSNVPITISPSKYIGKSDDLVDAGGTALTGHNNDFQIYGERIEFSFDTARGSAVGSVYQSCLQLLVSGSKIHGTDAAYNNYVTSAAWFDNCKNMWLPNLLVSHHVASVNYGKLMVCGQRTDIDFSGSSIGNADDEGTALLYLDPAVAGDSQCKILWENFNNNSVWPVANQVAFRYGSNGSIGQITAKGPSRRRTLAGLQDMPPSRIQSLFIAGTEFGFVPKTSFSPVFSFATNGDHVPSYTSQVGTYTDMGGIRYFDIALLFNTNAYTTASGGVRISLPGARVGGGATSVIIGGIENVTWAGSAKQFIGRLATTNDFITLQFLQTAAGYGTISTTHIPASTAGVRIELSGFYPII